MLIFDYEESVPFLSRLLGKYDFNKEEHYILALKNSENKLIESILDSPFGLSCMIELINLIKQNKFNLNQIYKINSNPEPLKELVFKKNQIAIEMYDKVDFLYNKNFERAANYLNDNSSIDEINREMQKNEKELRAPVDVIISALTKIPYRDEVYESIIQSFNQEHKLLKRMADLISQRGTQSKADLVYTERIRSIHKIPDLYQNGYLKRFSKIVKNNNKFFFEYRRARNDLINFEKQIADLISSQYDKLKVSNRIWAAAIKSLKKTVKEFDFFYNDNFLVYAFWNVIQNVLTIILEENSLTKKIPNEIIRKLYLLSEAISKEIYGGTLIPTLEDLSKSMNLPVSEIELLLDIYFNPFRYEYDITESNFKVTSLGKIKKSHSQINEKFEKQRGSSVRSLSQNDLVNKVFKNKPVAEDKAPKSQKIREKLIFVKKNSYLLEREEIHHQKRNPYVTELTKRIAGGTCQLCKKRAPFEDSRGVPYLETHHIEWLSEGGKDTLDNTVALCPNCHRKMHILKFEPDIINLKEAAKYNKMMASQAILKN